MCVCVCVCVIVAVDASSSPFPFHSTPAQVKCVWYIVLRAIREMTKSRLLRAAKDDGDKSSARRLSKHLEDLKKAAMHAKPSGREKLEEKIAELEKQCVRRYTTVAEELATALPRMWERKFDFMRPEVPDYEVIKPRFWTAAGEFVKWYAQEIETSLDGVSGMVVGEGGEEGGAEGGGEQGGGGGGGDDDLQSTDYFTRRFPLIWSKFLRDRPGVSDDFLDA